MAEEQISQKTLFSGSVSDFVDLSGNVHRCGLGILLSWHRKLLE